MPKSRSEVAVLVEESTRAVGAAPPRSAPAEALRYLPAAVGVLGALGILLLTDTRPVAALIYAIYFAVAVVIPGTLVYRLLAGYSDSLLADVAWGAVTGLMLELAGWAVFTVAGINRFLWAWPVLFLLIFVLVPGLRRLWRRPIDAGRTSPIAAWGTTAGYLLACGFMALQYYRFNPVPPSGAWYFVDFPWHLGVAYEAIRSVPLQTPEATAEGTLHYHWFADAHFGAASLVSGVELPVILARTGLFALLLVLVATVVSLGVKITGRPFVGALAALVAVATTPGAEFWTRFFKLRLVFAESPTSIFAVGVACLVTLFLVDLARGERLTRTRWILFGLTCFTAVGSKPSIILLLIPAACAVLGLDLVSRRPLNRGLLMGVGVMAAMFVVSLLLFASPGGSTIDPSLEQATHFQFGTSLPMLLLTALAKCYLLAVVAVAALWHRQLWADPAARLLGAITLVGFSAAWIISHPGLSQLFFWQSAIPFAGILGAWGLAHAVDQLGDRRRQVRVFVAFAVAAILIPMLVVRRLTETPVRYGWIAFLVALALVGVAAWRLRIPLRAAVLVTVVSVVALSNPVSQLEYSWRPGPPAPNPAKMAQTQAAAWVEANTPVNDLLATNGHCLGANPTAPNCDARSFWLSGFGGRRVLLAGYGVSPNALRQAGVGGIKAWRQPYHDQELLRLNDGAFATPTAEGLRRLHDEYGVRWLVADLTVPTDVAALDRLADLELANEGVRVYRLDPARLSG